MQIEYPHRLERGNKDNTIRGGSIAKTSEEWNYNLCNDHINMDTFKAEKR